MAAAPREETPRPKRDRDLRLGLWFSGIVSLVSAFGQANHDRFWGAQPTIALLVALVCAAVLVRDSLDRRRDRRQQPP